MVNHVKKALAPPRRHRVGPLRARLQPIQSSQVQLKRAEAVFLFPDAALTGCESASTMGRFWQRQHALNVITLCLCDQFAVHQAASATRL